jgi:hypothetical protein
MKLHQRTLAFVALAGMVAFTGACGKKGKGKGSRAARPGSIGSIMNDGNDNQGQNDPTETAAGMDLVAAEILAECFKLEVAEIAPVVGWTDKVEAQTAATALCSDIKKTGYDGTGVNNTMVPVQID